MLQNFLNHFAGNQKESDFDRNQCLMKLFNVLLSLNIENVKLFVGSFKCSEIKTYIFRMVTICHFSVFKTWMTCLETNFNQCAKTLEYVDALYMIIVDDLHSICEREDFEQIRNVTLSVEKQNFLGK